jgi:starch phosphorylase
MLADYLERLYLPAAESYRRRTAANLKAARDLRQWLRGLRRHWPEIHWGNVGIEAAGNEHIFRAQVYLGEIEPDAVSVELYAEPRPGEAARLRPMRRDRALSGAAGGYLYVASVPADRPAADYTPRVVAAHPEAQVPAETPLIRWYPN